MKIILQLIYSLLLFGTLILLHELGQLLLCKILKFKVLYFSIGFGKTIFKHSIYKLKLFPFGGTCNIVFIDHNSENQKPDELFTFKNLIKKSLIISGGPFLLYIFGLILLIITSTIGIKVNTYNNKIYVQDEILIKNKKILSPAKKYGLKNNDIIIAVNNKPVSTWYDIKNNLYTFKTDSYISLKVKRADKEYIIKIKPLLNPDTGQNILGILPQILYSLEDLNPNSVLKKAGLNKKDIIIKANDKNNKKIFDLPGYIKNNPHKEIKLYIKKGNNTKQYRAIIQKISQYGTINGHIKIKHYQKIKKSKNIFHAFTGGIKESIYIIKRSIIWIKIITLDKINIHTVYKSPITFISYILHKPDIDTIKIIYYFGYLSIILSFLFLIPLPILDGFYILIFTIESIIKKKINKHILKIIQSITMILLIIIMIWFMLNDIILLSYENVKQKTAIDFINKFIL